MTRSTGDAVPLTTPQLRVYLAAMDRLVDEYENRAVKASRSADPNFWEFSNGAATGVREATAQLLKALNLPPNWEAEMDRLEAEEARRGPA